jgi:aminomethyltransferase
MVDFAGWYMPVTYTNIMEEHRRVRTRMGLFDVSHMGRYWLSGPDHIAFTDKIITNERASMKPGQIRYSLILNGRGGTMDDVLVYSSGDEGTLLVVNAGNRKKIWDWLAVQRTGFNVHVDDRSDAYGMIALQGPESVAVLKKVSDIDTDALKYYRFSRGTVLGENEVLVSRTGYTGEDGFELIMPAAKAAHFWRELLNVGEGNGAGPAGLGARDTLRLEAGMPLYGHELEENINPLEAGVEWAVKVEKGDFIGKQATVELQRKGLKKKLVGLNVVGKRIPRQGQDVLHDGQTVGHIASGTKSPWLNDIIATAFVPPELAEVGVSFEVAFQSKATKSMKDDTRQRALVVPLPFYKRPKK